MFPLGSLNEVLLLYRTSAVSVFELNMRLCVYCISASLDFRPPSPTTVVFSPGSTSRSVSIPIEEDDIDEPLENFMVRLTLQSAPDDSVEVEPDRAEVLIGDIDGKHSFLL